MTTSSDRANLTMTGRLQTDLSHDGMMFDVNLPEPEPVRDQPIREPISQNVFEGVARVPIPVSTISRTMMPYTGLHLLTDLESVDIQQTVELDDLYSSTQAENRYVVRSPRRETVLVAIESSTLFQRRVWGPHRAQRMRLYDPSHQETLHLQRRLACGSGPRGLLGCSCYLQHVDVFVAPGDKLGSITQAYSMFVPELNVRGANGYVLYRIEGPSAMKSLISSPYKITSRDGLVELGSITYLWEPAQSSYITRVIFPSADLIINHKALVLSAAFLLIQMYFEYYARWDYRCLNRLCVPVCCC